MFIVEGLGDIPCPNWWGIDALSDKFTEADMGEISFLQMVSACVRACVRGYGCGCGCV